MSTTLLPAGMNADSIADKALNASARLWFFVAVIGQLILAAYVASFYGEAALTGHPNDWNRILTHGYIRGDDDVSQFAGGSLNAILILVCVVRALRSALAGKFAAHRRWVLRLFVVVSGAWFYRVGLFLWLLTNHGPVGLDPETFQGPALTF